MATYYENSNDSIRLIVDSSMGVPIRSFKVQAGNPAVTIFDVNEYGRVLVTGPIECSGSVYLDNATSTGDVVTFQAGGTSKAAVTSGGVGVFGAAGIRMLTDTAGTNPSGRLSGASGDIILWYNGASYEVWACQGGTTWNKATA